MNLRRRISKPLKQNARQLAAHMRFRYGGNHAFRNRATMALKALSAGVAYGAFVEPALLQTTQIEIVVRDLDPRLDGYRIAHLSDVHYNIAGGRDFLERVVERTNSLDPDLVALTGDFITHRPRNLDKCFAILSNLRAPDGCWVVRGNHDYRTTLEHMESACHEAGFRLMENESTRIHPSRHRASHAAGNGIDNPPLLSLAGVGDIWEGECRPGKALEKVDMSHPVILLSHHGDVAELITSDQRVDIILSGHTHGGQVRFRGKPIPIFSNGSTKYVSGLVEGGGARVYISRGVGTSALRFRWNCRPEIALICLHSGDRP